jgi:hypothetical protein
MARGARRQGCVLRDQSPSTCSASIIPLAVRRMRPVRMAFKTATWLTPRWRPYARMETSDIVLLVIIKYLYICMAAACRFVHGNSPRSANLRIARHAAGTRT